MTSTPSPATGENADVETLPLWNCVLQESLQGGAAKLDAFTVGNKYLLSCRGEGSGEWSEPIRFQWGDPSHQYGLFPIQVMNRSSSQIEMVVTGYKPGKYNVSDLIITDETHRIRSSALEWEIKSVLEGQKQAQPVPPFGPFQLGYPRWLYGVWGFLAILLLVVLWRQGRRYWVRKRLLEKLMSHRTALSPFYEFNKMLRATVRKINPAQPEKMAHLIQEMESQFRLYLVRQYLVPAQDWSDRAILREMKKQHRRVYDQVQVELRQLLNEYAKIRKATSITRIDLDQILEMTRGVADRMELTRSKEAQ